MQIEIKLKSGQKVLVKKESTDPKSLRASIGGLKGVGYYCVFRADEMLDIENMLIDVLVAFQKARAKFLISGN